MEIITSLLLQALDSDNEDDLILISIAKNYVSTKNKNKKRRVAIKQYMEKVVYHYDYDEFKSHFRLGRDTFAELLKQLGPSLKKRTANHGVGRETHTPEKQLLVALSMLANQEVYRTLAEKFDISKSTAWSYVKKVCVLLANESSKYISWPSTDTAQDVIRKFKKRSQFPGVLGAIDGSHIPITPPLSEQAAYCNRKGYHLIILQAVCNASYMLTDVFVGYPGRVHDARVFSNSPLNKRINENPQELFPHYNNHILGDSAYKCTQYILTPFKDNGHLSRKQKLFNQKHSATIEFL